MSLNFKFIPLTFITDENEIKKQIRNTVILRYFFDKNESIIKLKECIEGTQYGYNASALESGKNKFLRISDITDGKVDWESVPFCDCTDEKTYLLETDDILIARTGGTTGKSFMIKTPPSHAIYAGYLIRIRANDSILPEFLNIFLNSYIYWSQIVSMNEGEFRPSVNANKLKDLILPEVTEDEQNDIVKISNGELLSDYQTLNLQIEKALTEYDNSKIIINEFTTQLSNVNELKQAILQEAIQGKLTKVWRAQNPNIEPASELLKHIKAEKEQLIKDKKIKKEKPLPPIAEDEIPFELPEGWEFVRIPHVLALTNDPIRRGPFGSSLKKDMFEPKSNETTKVYEQQNAIKKDYTLGSYYISTKKHPNLNSFLTGPGDILISCAGTIGETYKLPETAPVGIINQALLKIRLNELAIIDDFFLFMFKSQLQKRVNSDAKGSAMKNMGSVKYLQNELFFGLPPFREQEEIIKRVKLLFEKINELESEIIQSEKHANMLMQAILKEAFESKKEEVYES